MLNIGLLAFPADFKLYHLFFLVLSHLKYILSHSISTPRGLTLHTLSLMALLFNCKIQIPGSSYLPLLLASRDI